MKTWNGKTWDQVAGMDPKEAKIEGVSGASLTSLCIANGIRHRFRHSTEAAAAPPQPFQFGWQDGGRRRGATRGRALHVHCTSAAGRGSGGRSNSCSIGYLGLWNGQLLAQSLMGGWAASGVPWRLAPGLVLLLAAALVVPWTTRRALYCSHVCPHGAAQEWAGRLTRRRLRIPRGIEAGLRWPPWLLIALVLVVTMLTLPFNLADIEPFDAYLVRGRRGSPLPRPSPSPWSAWPRPPSSRWPTASTAARPAWCLGFVRSHGKADHFGRRDVAAGLLVLLVIVLFVRYDSLHLWVTRHG